MAVAATLAVWLLPLVAIALTSLRSQEDLNRGNFWGWPTRSQLFDNYATVLTDSRLPQFVLNSFLVTIPAVVGTVVFASMAGFALAKHEFKGSRLLLMVFIGGNLVPFQALMIPCAISSSRSGSTIRAGAHPVPHRLPDRLLHAVHAQLHPRHPRRRPRRRARRRRGGADDLLAHRPAARPAGDRRRFGTDLHVVWNDYFWSLVLVQSDAIRPLTAGLQSLRGMWQTSWPLVAAGSLLAAVPPVAVFFLCSGT